MKRVPALLTLEDGSAFGGEAFASQPFTVAGEVVFNTAMSGYQEVLTDPSYRRQIVCMAAPEIGNYGTNPDDAESDRIQVTAFVVRQAARRASNWRARRTLAEELEAVGVPGVEGIDTRRLVRHLRSAGAMRGATAWRWSTRSPGRRRWSWRPKARSGSGWCSTTSAPRTTSPGGCAGSAPRC